MTDQSIKEDRYFNDRREKSLKRIQGKKPRASFGERQMPRSAVEVIASSAFLTESAGTAPTFLTEPAGTAPTFLTKPKEQRNVFRVKTLRAAFKTRMPCEL